MMWPLFIIFSELAAMASGHICCAPSQWEASGRLLSGNTDSNGGLPYRGFGTFNVSVDSENQRVASNNILTEANITLPFKLLLLYKSQEMYIIVNNTNCLNYMLDEWKPPCIPDQATLVRRFYLGPEYEFPIYEYVYGSSRNETTVTGVIHDCIPTFQKIYGNDFMDILNFFGYTSGIKDPHVFDIPDICDHQATSDWTLQPETIKNLYPGVLGMMIRRLQSTFSMR